MCYERYIKPFGIIINLYQLDNFEFQNSNRHENMFNIFYFSFALKYMSPIYVPYMQYSTCTKYLLYPLCIQFLETK